MIYYSVIDFIYLVNDILQTILRNHFLIIKMEIFTVV